MLLALSEVPAYASIVRDELGLRLAPALASAQQQAAFCGHRVLARLTAEYRAAPALESRLRSGLRPLIAELRAASDSPAVSAALADVEEQLNAEGDFGSLESAVQVLVTALLGVGSAQSDGVISRLTALFGELRQQFMRAYQEDIAGSGARDSAGPILSEAQTERLAAWLRARLPGNDSLRITAVRQIPGGFSKQTLFVSLTDAATLPETVVVRLDWAQSAVGTTVVNEFGIIERLHDAGIAVPRPFALEPTGKVLGGAFLVVSKAEGGNIGDYLDVQAGSAAFAKELAGALARLHAVPVASFGEAVDGARETVTARLLREIGDFEAAWRALGIPSVELEVAFSWLKKNIDLADGPRSLIHKDVGCHNMLVKDDRLTALLDWETAAIGTAAQDLGYVHPTVCQMGDWQDFLAAYAEAGGAVPDERRINWYTLWGYTWLNAMLMQAEAAFTSGAAPDLRLAYAGAYLRPRLAERLAGALSRVLASTLERF